jgi:hypothetical protein
MLTIHNIERISNYSSATISVETTNWAYIFQIENKFGPTYQITLSRIHPPQSNHPHRDWYCMTYEGQQMWVQRNDVMDCQKFLIQMTHFMANII